MVKKVLIIDDDIDLCVLLSRYLTQKGFETGMAHSGQKGLALYSAEPFDAVICDFRLGDMDAIKLITKLKKVDPNAAILVITGYSDIKTAVEVIKLGAYDYITKPLIPDEVLAILARIGNGDKGLEAPVTEEQTPVKRVSDAQKTLSYFTGTSGASLFLYEQVNVVASTNYSVILYGESGTGKEVIARTIHDLSPRSSKPFVAIDCGTLSKELASSELFGHMKGSFTGALQDKEGHFEIAQGGTLFLDEVGNLSVEVQAVLLRVIQERKFKRVGGTKEIPVDVRVIVASNENLMDACAKGRFREDLYHRFNEFSISLPPLRDRKDDISSLADFFLEQSNHETGKVIKGFDLNVQRIFMEYPWPGNLREFRNVIRRAVLLTESGTYVNVNALPAEMSSVQPLSELEMKLKKDMMNGTRTPGSKMAEKDVLKIAASRAEFNTIMSVLQQVNFNKKKAAELLKIDRKTLYNKLKVFQDYQHMQE
jgi:two-component system response regulator HydG